jgi:hypothetical protein
MTAESDAFEQLNARVSKLIHGANAQVTWNANIPDPDDVTQTRQIDALIEKGGLRTGVECRDREAAQSVMWVEELVGRKQSLKLDAMIGVAVNGFTPLARTKAKRYGIALYDFHALSDPEIASWGGLARVEAVFVQFDPLNIVAAIPNALAPQVAVDVSFQKDGKDGYAAVMDAIRDGAAAHQGATGVTDLAPAGYTVDGIPVRILNAGYMGRLVTEVATCSAVEMIGPPGLSAAIREISVQRFDHSVPQIIRKQDEAILVVDVDALRAPPNSILHELRVIFPVVTTVREYELIGSRRITTSANSIMLQVVGIP